MYNASAEAGSSIDMATNSLNVRNNGTGIREPVSIPWGAFLFAAYDPT